MDADIADARAVYRGSASSGQRSGTRLRLLQLFARRSPPLHRIGRAAWPDPDRRREQRPASCIERLCAFHE